MYISFTSSDISSNCEAKEANSAESLFTFVGFIPNNEAFSGDIFDNLPETPFIPILLSERT